MTSSSEPASLADLFRLKRFLVVAEMGSLTKAAVVLDTTQSALSLQMAALERECGQRLFDRTGRGVALTEQVMAGHLGAARPMQAYMPPGMP